MPRLSIDLSIEEHKILRKRAIDDGLSIKQIGESLFRIYLKAKIKKKDMEGFL